MYEEYKAMSSKKFDLKQASAQLSGIYQTAENAGLVKLDQVHSFLIENGINDDQLSALLEVTWPKYKGRDNQIKTPTQWSEVKRMHTYRAIYKEKIRPVAEKAGTLVEDGVKVGMYQLIKKTLSLTAKNQGVVPTASVVAVSFKPAVKNFKEKVETWEKAMKRLIKQANEIGVFTPYTTPQGVLMFTVVAKPVEDDADE